MSENLLVSLTKFQSSNSHSKYLLVTNYIY